MKTLQQIKNELQYMSMLSTWRAKDKFDRILNNAMFDLDNLHYYSIRRIYDIEAIDSYHAYQARSKLLG